MPIAKSLTSSASNRFRVLFTTEADANAEIIARFTDPQPMVAVRQMIDTDDTPLGNQIEIVFGKAPADTSGMIEVKTETARLYWEPGRAFLQASASDCKLFMPALIEFAHHEGELRRLEEAIVPHEITANADVIFAYKMMTQNRSEWDRLYRTIEQLYGLRLQFARLEPHLCSASRSLPIESRRLFARLAAKTQVADRLEALSDRLEACEDLYEGAVDRITDFKAYRKGALLEVAIVVLLAVEVVLLLLQWHRV